MDRESIGTRLPPLPIPRLKNNSKFVLKNTNKKTKKPSQSPLIKRSCDHCRKRKVRCDANEQHPCSHCKKIGSSCQFLSQPKKTGLPPKRYTESLEERIIVLEQLLEEERNKNKSILNQQQSYEQQQQAPMSEIYLSSTAETSNTQFDQQKAMDDGPIQSIYRENISIIEEIPGLTAELAERILQAYFTQAHRNVPVVNKRAFLLQFYYQYPEPLDPHLFYALLALGYQFLPRQQLDAKVGSTTMYSLGCSLREKAMEVMNLINKESTISRIQTLVLVAMFAPTADNNNGGTASNWFIIGVAIRMSQDMGLYNDANYKHLASSEAEIRRRLVYCIYIVDVFISAMNGKPLSFKDGNFDVQFPSAYEITSEADGFNLDSIPNASVPKLLAQTEMDIIENRLIYTGHAEMISSSHLIGHIVTLFYMPKINSPDISSDKIAHLDKELVAWQAKSTISYSKHNSGIHQILFDAVLILRYRPIITQMSKENMKDHLQLLDLCTMAANNIIDWVDTMSILGVSTAIEYVVTQAAAIFLHNYYCMDTETARIEARNNLTRCVKLHRRYGTTYSLKNATALNQILDRISMELNSSSNQQS